MTTAIYISGPMRGIPNFNYDAFNDEAKRLRALGYKVFNPAESFDGSQDLPWETYMRKDIEDLLKSDAVYVLPGWEKSSGAKVELCVAHALGLPIWSGAEDGRPRKQVDVSHLVQPDAPVEAKSLEQETVLQEANRIIYGARQADYGHPYEDFSRTAGFWSVLFGTDVTAEQVPMALWLMKTSRLMNGLKRDSIVDVAGYAGTLQMLLDKSHGD